MHSSNRSRALAALSARNLLLAALAVLTLVGLALGARAALAQATPPASPTTYVVQVGDSWISLARRFDVTVNALKAANPGSVRVNDWLRTGETLMIPVTAPVPATGVPVAPPAAAPATSIPLIAPIAPATASAAVPMSQPAEPVIHVVGSGESWNSIAARYDVSARELRDANPDLVRSGLVLYRGDEILIPTTVVVGPNGESTVLFGAAPTVTPSSTPTQPAVPTFTPTATLTPTPTFTPCPPIPLGNPDSPGADTPTPEPTVAPTATPCPEDGFLPVTVDPGLAPASAATPQPEPTATPATRSGLSCPATMADFPAAIALVLNTPSLALDGLADYLDDCGASVDDSLDLIDLTGDNVDELVVIYANPGAPESSPSGDMLIFAQNGAAYSQTFRAFAGGKVSVLDSGDFNQDGRPDLLYADSSCSASTCFDTVQIRSWDGSAWADWIAGNVVMAYPDVWLDEEADAGQGLELVLEGGVYGSTNAGPQRSRTEVYGSVAGAPYTLVARSFDESDCLYFAVIDANAVFSTLPNTDLNALEQLYTRAATDAALETCWNRPDEEAELRSFALFRLAQVATWQGVPEVGSDLIASISTLYPQSPWAQTGQLWLDTIAQTQSTAAACQAVAGFVASNPSVGEALSSYGYANPDFGAADICPPGEMGNAAVSMSNAKASALAAAADAGAPPTPLPPAPAAAPSKVSASGENCPASLAEFTPAFPLLFAQTGPDAQAIAGWMRACGAMNEEHGAVATADFNADGQTDILVVPVVESDSGFGPEGTEGAVLIYHGTGGNNFREVFAPEIYGQANLLAVEDLTGDGDAELAWTIEGCSTFCVTELQVVGWDAEAGAYRSQIAPGATLAQGEARIEALPAGSPGSGRQIVLQGGVSGTREGGLPVAHTEVWQAVDGGPFQRLGWQYDRDDEGSNCLALRLVEADAALQASFALGYERAIAAYQEALSPELEACSMFGMDGVEEMILLQGLGSFRLVQALALAGRTAEADAAASALLAGQPESDYAAAATQWLTAWTSSNDAAAACAAVAPTFAANSMLSQITTHFGYNHPALTPEQLCFVPAQ